MTLDPRRGLHIAGEGRMFIRKSDGLVMGDGIDVGVDDDIANYEERVFTVEEMDVFRKSAGMRLLHSTRACTDALPSAGDAANDTTIR